MIFCTDKCGMADRIEIEHNRIRLVRKKLGQWGKYLYQYVVNNFKMPNCVNNWNKFKNTEKTI